MNIKFQNFVRRILGRGRKRHFYVTPPIRIIRKLFERHPIVMNCLSYGSLYASAEISQQTIKNYLNSNPSNGGKMAKKYDLTSIKRLALWGTFVVPPIYYQWYQWLERKFPPCKITGVITKHNILKKTLLDQFIFTPPLLILFFAGMAALEYAKNKPEMWVKIKSELKDKLPPVYLADCAFWIPVQAFNFAYVPPTWRVLYIGIMSFVWLNFLCAARTYNPEHSDHHNEK